MEPEPTRRELLTALTTAAGAAATASTAAGSGLATAQSLDDRWPMFGYDLANTGHNPEAAGVPADPGPAWGVRTDGPVQASPTVVDGRVYVGSTDTTVYALDAADGDELWTVGTGGPVRAAPAVADGTVYVGSDDGTVYALDATGGDVDWTFETDGEVRAAPAVVGETVYVGSWDQTVYAIDATDGTEEWSFETAEAVDAAVAVVTDETAPGSPDTAGPPEGVVYVGSRDGRVYALDAADGSRNWTFATEAPVAGAPAVADDRVYAGNLNGQVYGLTADEGEEAWNFDTGGAVVTSPAVADGRVYVASRGGAASRIHAIADGQELWVFEADGEVTSPAIADGRVYAGSRDEHVYAVDTAGEEQWSFAADQAVQSAPAVAGETLYVGSEAGTVYALAEGADGPVGGGNGTGEPGDDDGLTDGDSDDGTGDFRFLLFPASVVTFVAVILAGLYAAHRAGLLARIEAAADEVEPAFGPSESETGDSDGAGTATADSDGTGGSGETTPVWELVVADVIARAEQTDRTATQDLLVTKYVDSGTLDSPVVAYEIESYRDDPARIRIVEPRFEGDDEPGDSQPLGDGWRVEPEQLVFEAVVDPDESVKTIVGRPDCPADRLDSLLDRPDITVEEAS